MKLSFGDDDEDDEADKRTETGNDADPAPSPESSRNDECDPHDERTVCARHCGEVG